MSLGAGTRLGAYEVVELIGAGGMGVVYKARDPRLDRLVAIKVLPRDLTRDDLAKQRFLLEAKAASALDHPNICTIHEIDETPDGELYLVSFPVLAPEGVTFTPTEPTGSPHLAVSPDGRRLAFIAAGPGRQPML